MTSSIKDFADLFNIFFTSFPRALLRYNAYETISTVSGAGHLSETRIVALSNDAVSAATEGALTDGSVASIRVSLASRISTFVSKTAYPGIVVNIRIV